MHNVSNIDTWKQNDWKVEPMTSESQVQRFYSPSKSLHHWAIVHCAASHLRCKWCKQYNNCIYICILDVKYTYNMIFMYCWHYI